MKTAISTLMLLGVAGTAAAQQSTPSEQIGEWRNKDPNGCDMVYGQGHSVCQADHYVIQRDEKTLDQQAQLQRAIEENQRLRTELLRRDLTAPAAQPAAAGPPSAEDFAVIPGFVDWHTDNRWFGLDKPRTEFALLYARELRQEHPELAGRPLLNAISVRVREIFAPARR